MSDQQPLTRGGLPWVPQYLDAVDPETCIGCGRCYKVCGRGVLEMKGVTEDGDIVDADDDEAFRKVMSVEHGEQCIGCNACGLVCGKNCQTHVTA